MAGTEWPARRVLSTRAMTSALPASMRSFSSAQLTLLRVTVIPAAAASCTETKRRSPSDSWFPCSLHPDVLCQPLTLSQKKRPTCPPQYNSRSRHYCVMF